MRSQLLAITAAVLVLSLIGAERLYGQTANPPEPQLDRHSELQRMRLLSQTVRDEGIHAAAKLNGGEFVFDDSLETQWRARPRDLDGLVRSAPVAVLGTVQSAEPRVTHNRRSIETVYEVSVIETLRGPGRGSVPIRAPGGRVTFGDGTAAEVRTPGFAITVGKTYLFFLRAQEDGAGVNQDDLARNMHVLAVGPQGVFDLSMGRVQSLARAENLIRVQSDGREAQGFLTELRAAIQKAESNPR